MEFTILLFKGIFDRIYDLVFPIESIKLGTNIKTFSLRIYFLRTIKINK